MTFKCSLPLLLLIAAHSTFLLSSFPWTTLSIIYLSRTPSIHHMYNLPPLETCMIQKQPLLEALIVRRRRKRRKRMMMTTGALSNNSSIRMSQTLTGVVRPLHIQSQQGVYISLRNLGASNTSILRLTSTSGHQKSNTRVSHAHQGLRTTTQDSDRKRRPGRPRGSKNRKPHSGTTIAKQQEGQFYYQGQSSTSRLAAHPHNTQTSTYTTKNTTNSNGAS
jgi:hypothetical protein